MSVSLKWVHVCVAVVKNKQYRCQRCNERFDLAGAVQHAVQNQTTVTGKE